MIITYDMDSLDINRTRAEACINFKKFMEGVEIDTEDPSFVLTIVRRSSDNSKLTIDSAPFRIFNKFDEIMLSYAGIDIHKIPVIRLFTERLNTNEICPSMEIKFMDKQLSYEFNNRNNTWDKTEGDIVFDTTQYVLLGNIEMDQEFNKLRGSKMTILYDIDEIENGGVSVIEHENFRNLLEKVGIDSNEIKHVIFRRIKNIGATSPIILDNIYETLEDLMLYNLGINIDGIGNIKRETKFGETIPLIQVRLHGKQLVYDFDMTIFDWVKRDDILLLIDDEIN